LRSKRKGAERPAEPCRQKGQRGALAIVQKFAPA